MQHDVKPKGKGKSGAPPPPASAGGPKAKSKAATGQSHWQVNVGPNKLLEQRVPLLNESLEMGGELVPTWAFDQNAARVVREMKRNDQEIETLTHMGPAVIELVKANCVLWSFFAIYPWLASAMATCPSNGGFARVPGVTLLIYFPILAAALVYELRALRYVLPCHLMVAGCPVYFGKELTFHIWFAKELLFSVMAHMDFATNSMFLAKVLRTTSCSNDVGAAWTQIMENSWLPIFAELSLSLTTLITWMLMFCQLIYVLGFVLPLGPAKPRRGSSHVPTTDYDLKEPNEETSRYRTLLAKEGSHRSSLYVAADGSRTGSILCQQRSFALKVHADMPVGTVAYSSLKMHVFRTTVFLVVESMLFLNIQALTLLIHRRLTGAVDWQTAFSVSLGIVASLKSLVDNGSVIQGYYVDMLDGHARYEQLDSETMAMYDIYYPSERDVIEKSRFCVKAFTVVAFVAACLILVALVHAVEAVI